MIKNEILKIKIAKLFYHNGFSKVEIAKKLMITRLKVANMLEGAITDGIVKIIIKEPLNSYIDLENKIEKRFGINRAVVTETGMNYEETKKYIGRAAADCFEELNNDNDVIGVAWGSSTLEMIKSLPQKIHRKNIKVVQMVGGSYLITVDVGAPELTRRISNIFNAKSYYLHAPSIVNSKKAKDILLSEDGIKRTFEMFKRINFALVGIGSTSPLPPTIMDRIKSIDKADLNGITKNCVGDINLHFYDKNGIECKNILQDKVIGISLEELRRVRNVMAIAGGEQKIDAIYSALKSRLINIIVTDYKTAKSILAKDY